MGTCPGGNGLTRDLGVLAAGGVFACKHSIGKYTVPAFLAASWYATDDPFAEKKRDWFVAHARGVSFRSLDLPIDMTRKMEHIFLMSRDHLAIEHAMRRAELLALGAPDELVQSVLATRSATDLGNGAFWQTVWMFLIANAGAIDLAQVGPVIDFVQAIRHERVAVETPDGIVLRDPPQPSFSMKGRTVQSMLRLMQEWHRSLGLANGGLTWAPSPLQPMMIEEPSQDPAAPPSVSGCTAHRQSHAPSAAPLIPASCRGVVPLSGFGGNVRSVGRVRTRSESQLRRRRSPPPASLHQRASIRRRLYGCSSPHSRRPRGRPSPDLGHWWG